MVDTNQLSETIQGLKGAAKTALCNESVDDFEAFERYLSEVEAYTREVQQSMWADEARATIRRLEKGDSLTQADQDLLRTFLVSDAKGYLAAENDYTQWVRELERLTQDLARRVEMVDRSSIAELRGVLKDAIRLAPDIRNYLEERRRVERFEKAIDTQDPGSRDMLLRVLKEQLRSPKR
jgi:hypothetical protein